jgi:hypothetical protein
MLAIFVATTSIALSSYARIVLLDSTIEGARYAALADQDIVAGIARTKKLVADGLGPAISVDVVGAVSTIGSLESIRLVSTLGINLIPGSKILIASSVATREVEY